MYWPYLSLQLKEIKKKPIRKFYENQNERLNDWLEVDTLVKHLADDIIESFDPLDHDGDGIPDGNDVPLASEANNIEPFLPQDEREKRAKSKKYARWAIYVSAAIQLTVLCAKLRERSTSWPTSVFLRPRLLLSSTLRLSRWLLRQSIAPWTYSVRSSFSERTDLYRGRCLRSVNVFPYVCYPPRHTFRFC